MAALHPERAEPTEGWRRAPSPARRPRLPDRASTLGDRARWLRRDQTEAEYGLWPRAQSGQVKGAKFRSQHPIGEYRVTAITLLTQPHCVKSSKSHTGMERRGASSPYVGRCKAIDLRRRGARFASAARGQAYLANWLGRDSRRSVLRSTTGAGPRQPGTFTFITLVPGGRIATQAPPPAISMVNEGIQNLPPAPIQGRSASPGAGRF